MGAGVVESTKFQFRSSTFIEPMKKNTFQFLYWLIASVLLALVYRSFVDGLAQSWMLATMLLPGAFLARGVAPVLWRSYKKKFHYWLYLLIGVMWLEYMGAIAAYWFLFELDPENFPAVLINPAFSLFWITSLILGEFFISEKLWPASPEKISYLSFISNRKEARLQESKVLYIESRDRFTVLHTTSNQEMPTQQKISQWEEELPHWIRTHRSFLVNLSHIQTISATSLTLVDDARREIEIPISRSYKANVMERLRAEKA